MLLFCILSVGCVIVLVGILLISVSVFELSKLLIECQLLDELLLLQFELCHRGRLIRNDICQKPGDQETNVLKKGLNNRKMKINRKQGRNKGHNYCKLKG